MKTDRLGLIRTNYSLKPVSFMEIGKEIITNSPTVQSVTDAHDKMMTGIKVVGFGLFGLFAVRQFIK